MFYLFSCSSFFLLCSSLTCFSFYFPYSYSTVFNHLLLYFLFLSFVICPVFFLFFFFLQFSFICFFILFTFIFFLIYYPISLCLVYVLSMFFSFCLPFLISFIFLFLLCHLCFLISSQYPCLHLPLSYCTVLFSLLRLFTTYTDSIFLLKPITGCSFFHSTLAVYLVKKKMLAKGKNGLHQDELVKSAACDLESLTDPIGDIFAPVLSALNIYKSIVANFA